MGKSLRFVLVLACFTAIMAVISACGSIQHYYVDKFEGDPLTYLVGEWEGTVNIPGSTHPEAERMLIIPPQRTSSILTAYYGIPGTRFQGRTTVYVGHSEGRISVNFKTGSGSRATLWLMRMNGEYVLNGELRTTNLPNQMILRKKK